MLTFVIPQEDIQQLKRLVNNSKKRLRVQLKIAVSKAAAGVKTKMNKDIREIVSIRSKGINRVLKVKRKATTTNLSSTVVLYKTKKGMPLKFYSPKQTGEGVTYRALKGGGLHVVKHAFMGPTPKRKNPKFGGHAFERYGPKVQMTKGSYEGQMRQQIRKLYGPSPHEIHIQNKLTPPTRKYAKERMRSEVKRRIHYWTQKLSGELRGKQK